MVVYSSHFCYCYLIRCFFSLLFRFSISELIIVQVKYQNQSQNHILQEMEYQVPRNRTPSPSSKKSYTKKIDTEAEREKSKHGRHTLALVLPSPCFQRPPVRPPETPLSTWGRGQWEAWTVSSLSQLLEADCKPPY